MNKYLKHFCKLSARTITHTCALIQAIARSTIHVLIVLSFSLGSGPSQGGYTCVDDRTASPCFRPTTIKDDNTPFAFDFCTIYEMARCHDPSLQAAKQAQLAVQEALPQASASFLPVISAQAAHTNAYNNGGGITDENDTIVGKVGSYVSNVYTLALTQPILHFEHWQKHEQACDLVKQANATYAFAEQDLMIRTAQAYFGVLEALDRLYFSTAQLKALKKFYDQTGERFKVGLIAITDVQIAKASHDSAVAQVINSRTAVSNQLEKLREIVGYRVEHLLPLKDNLTLPTPQPSDPDQWVAVSLKQNFELQAQRYKTLAARDDIKITEMGHLPTIDLNGQMQRTTPNNQVQFAGTVSQLSVQVNLPLFSGGSVISKTRQARHTFLQRDKETEALFRLVESNTRQFYLNVITQISQVAAFKQAVISNQSALDATQASFNVGTRTIVDVLNAQTGLIQAQLNLATARYLYILQSLQLKRSAGILSPMDLCSINHWLKSTPADAVVTMDDITKAIALNSAPKVEDTANDAKDAQDARDTSIEADTDNSIGVGVAHESAKKLGNVPEEDETKKTDKTDKTDQTKTVINPDINVETTPSDTVPDTTTTTPLSGSGGPISTQLNPAPSTTTGTETGTGTGSEIKYPGSSITPTSDPFNASPNPNLDAKQPHAPPPPPTQTNPTTSPSATPSATPSSSPGAFNDLNNNQNMNMKWENIETIMNAAKQKSPNLKIYSGAFTALQVEGVEPAARIIPVEDIDPMEDIAHAEAMMQVEDMTHVEDKPITYAEDITHVVDKPITYAEDKQITYAEDITLTADITNGEDITKTKSYLFNINFETVSAKNAILKFNAESLAKNAEPITENAKPTAMNAPITENVEPITQKPEPMAKNSEVQNTEITIGMVSAKYLFLKMEIDPLTQKESPLTEKIKLAIGNT